MQTMQTGSVKQEDVNRQKILSSKVHARFGSANPEPVNNYFYEYMVKHPHLSAWDAEQKLNQFFN